MPHDGLPAVPESCIVMIAERRWVEGKLNQTLPSKKVKRQLLQTAALRFFVVFRSTPLFLLSNGSHTGEKKVVNSPQKPLEYEQFIPHAY